MPFDISSPNQRRDNWLRTLRPATWTPQTGFMQNLDAALNQTFYEGTSFSRYIVKRPYVKERNKKLFNWARENMSEREVAAFRNRAGDDFDYDLMAHYAKSKYDFDIETDDEIMEKIRDDLKIVRTYNEDIARRANLPGLVGRFAGEAAATMLDPVLLPGFFFGYGAVAHSTKIIGAMARAALRVGVAEAGLEAARQVPVSLWKHDVGADYSISDAIGTIAMTAGIAGGLGASASALAIGLKRLSLKATSAYATATQKWAKRKVDQAIGEMFDAPDPDMPAVEHAAKIDGEVQYQETGRGPVREPDWQDIDVTEASLTEGYERNVTQQPVVPGDTATDEVVDAAYEGLYRENADIEVPTGEYVDLPEGQVPTMKKAQEVLEEHDRAADLINRMKECLIRGY